ncbi:hypothetical protein CgunFtcFv8_007990 [Champsocephalus gunnari]|uniref:Myb/SANT-like DNA-binding domain-containing protein n=1 Tax=Champsocephalus gunnari TaxID=52237 RepID=A0AAN8HEQ4_CHAGU|nr:hypothetical protein CgunFtcFv8_007990 [Champsocephalus gunnari]
MADKRRSFTDAETLALISARVKMEHMFSGKRNAAKSGWEQVVKEMGLEGQVTGPQAAKKWDNLKTKYKELKNPPTGTGTDGGEASAATWPCHGRTAAEASTSAAEASTSAAEASTSAAEASTSAAEASTSAAEASSAGEGPAQVSLSSEEEPVPSTSSQPPTKRPRRRSSVLAFLKKQAEKDEARDAALYDQNERLLKALNEQNERILLILSELVKNTNK